MNYEELGESSKSAICQLFYINELERLSPKMIDDFYKKQRTGILSMMPKNISVDMLPEIIKNEISKRALSEFRLTNQRKTK